MTLALVNVSNPFARQLCEQQYRSNLFLACLLVPYVPLARFLKKFALLRLRDAYSLVAITGTRARRHSTAVTEHG